MANTKATKILSRSGTKLEWDVAGNRADLEVGEIGVEYDTGRLKIGNDENGPILWSQLTYFAAGITSVQGVDGTHENGLTVHNDGTLELDITSLEGIVEAIDLDMKALADTVDALVDQVGQHEIDIEALQEHALITDGKLDTISDKLDTVDALHDGLEDSIDAILDRLDSVETMADVAHNIAVGNTVAITQLHLKVDALDSIKIEDSDLDPIRDRLDSLEGGAGTEDIELRLDSIGNVVDTLQDSIIYHDSVLVYHNNLLASLNGEIDGHTVRLDDLDSVISDAVDSIAVLDDVKLTAADLRATNKPNNRYDGGYLSYKDGSDGNGTRYIYRQSLPIRGIVEDVNQHLIDNFSGANDTIKAIEGFNKFMELCLAEPISTTEIPVGDLEP